MNATDHNKANPWLTDTGSVEKAAVKKNHFVVKLFTALFMLLIGLVLICIKAAVALLVRGTDRTSDADDDDAPYIDDVEKYGSCDYKYPWESDK